jgi:signal transduction histidine kinase
MTEFEERLSRVLEQAIYGDFILGIIHNLSTPLSGILGGAQLLEMRLKNWVTLVENEMSAKPEVLEKIQADHQKNLSNVELIIRNAKNLSDLIANMVQTHNKSVIEDVEVVNLPEYLRQVFKFLEGSMVFKHQVKKHYDLPEKVPPLRIIYNHVAQLLVEWIRRCLPAMEAQKDAELYVKIDADDDTIALTLTLSVPFEEAEQIGDVSEELIPFERGLRLPLSLYITRVEQSGQKVQVTDNDGKATLKITFQRT